LGAAISAAAEANQTPLIGEVSQCAEHLALAGKIAKFAREEGIVTPLGYPCLYPLPQGLPTHYFPLPAKTRL
jgi:hypothetical protein